jgi:hypothetical protein
MVFNLVVQRLVTKGRKLSTTVGYESYARIHVGPFVGEKSILGCPEALDRPDPRHDEGASTRREPGRRRHRTPG